MTKLLSLVSGWQGYVALALACFLAGNFATWRVMSWKEAAAVTHQAQQTVRLIEHQAQITFNVSMKFEAVRLADQQHTAQLIEEIPAHVTPKDDAACAVGLGFVRVFNAATRGPVPDAASGPDAAPSGVALSDVAKVTTQDFGQYDQLSHQLEALQDWVRQQQAAAPK